MQDALRFHCVGCHAGEPKAEAAVAIDQLAFPAESMPAFHLPAETAETIGVMVADASIDDVLFHGFGVQVLAVGRWQGDGQSQSFLGDGIQQLNEVGHTKVFNGSLHGAPICFLFQRPAAERPIYQFAQGDAAGREVACHVSQQKENFESG